MRVLLRGPNQEAPPEWQVNSGTTSTRPGQGSGALATTTTGARRDGKGGVVGVREQRLAQRRNECLLWTEQRFGNSFDYMVMVDLTFAWTRGAS